MSAACFECRAPATYRHHVVPRSRGGTKTVPLCGLCHAKAHHRGRAMVTGELTRSALAHKIRRGEAVNRGPRGLRISGKVLEADPESDGLTMYRRARELRAEGETFRRIAEALTAEGFRPRRPGAGERIAAATVRYMLRNPNLARVA